MTCIYLCSRYLVMLPILAFVEDVIEYKRLISDLYQLGCLIDSSNIFLLEICFSLGIPGLWGAKIDTKPELYLIPKCL